MPRPNFYNISITQKSSRTRILPLNNDRITNTSTNIILRTNNSEETINPLFQEEIEEEINKTELNDIYLRNIENEKKQLYTCQKEESKSNESKSQECHHQETCIICLDELNDTEKLKPCQTCNTYMDKKCLVKYLSHRNSNLNCPTCFKKLDLEYIKQDLISENEIQTIIRNIEREIRAIDNVSIDVDVDVDVDVDLDLYIRIGRFKCNKGHLTLILCIIFGLLITVGMLLLKGK